VSGCPHFKYLLVLPRLCIQNANAISSALTHGFPSMTAFLGLSWALERKARKAGLDLQFKAVGVVCHDHQVQTTQGGFVDAFHLTRNPVGKDGSTAAIVEEGRIHLELSLVLAVHADLWDPATRDADVATLADLLVGMRVAGGSVVQPHASGGRRTRPWVTDFTGTEEDQRRAFREVSVRLLPGTALVARDALIDQRLAELQVHRPEATRLDAWLSLSRINWWHEAEANGGKGGWRHDREGRGWVVPIPVGYGALGPVHAAGSVANARDAITPFRFVESLYSAGEWVGPHRLRMPQQLLWYADSRPEDGIYRCRNDYQPPDDTLV
jgi:CRISPR-associated protein Csy2